MRGTLPEEAMQNGGDPRNDILVNGVLFFGVVLRHLQWILYVGNVYCTPSVEIPELLHGPQSGQTSTSWLISSTPSSLSLSFIGE